MISLVDLNDDFFNSLRSKKGYYKVVLEKGGLSEGNRLLADNRNHFVVGRSSRT